MVATLLAISAVFGPPLDIAHQRMEIRRVVRKHMSQVLHCNALTPRQEDSLCTGWVNLRLQVDASGRVTRSELARNTLKNTIVPLCLLQISRTWRFATGPVEVVYPFHFRCAW